MIAIIKNAEIICNCTHHGMALTAAISGLRANIDLM
jgi:hypothetical protein